jgi:hypothetical protein
MQLKITVVYDNFYESILDLELGLSLWDLRTWPTYDLLECDAVLWYNDTDVSKEHTAYILRVEE